MAEVDLKRFAGTLWRWLWLVAISTGIAAGASYHASQSMPAIYRTSLTLMVGEGTANPRASLDEVSTSQRLAAVYARTVRRRAVLEATVNSLGLQTDWRELEDRVLVSSVEGTQFLEIRVIDSDPQRAKATADEIASQLIAQSPTAENVQQLEERRQFVRRQLDALQTSIQQAEATLAQKQAALEKEVSARGVLDRQDEIRALELKLTNWRSVYASLLSSYQGKPPNTLSVVEPAFVPTEPISPNVRANVLMAAALGCLLAVGAAFLIEYFNDTLDTAEDVTRILALPSLGSITHMGRVGNSTKGLITIRDPHSAVSEAYRVLRTNTQLTYADNGPATLLITSPGLREGKSITSANLAASFAQAGKRTILVDADLRHPSVHNFFGVTNHGGLASLFLDEPSRPTEHQPEQTSAAQQLRRRLEAYLVSTDVPGLRLLPSGPALVVNPAELLASAKMEQLLRLLRGMADVVILDGPAALPVADTTILAAKGVGVILVAEAGKTRNLSARLANEALVRTHAHILGVVLNKAPRTSLAYHRYRYREAKPNRLGALPRVLGRALRGLWAATGQELAPPGLSRISGAVSRMTGSLRTRIE